MKILHAEDDDGYALLVDIKLKENGISNEIIRFRDGSGLLTYLDSINSESDNKLIIILDLKMPKTDGFDVLSYLNCNQVHSNIKVIVFSTTDFPDDVEKCYKLGCDYFLSKNYEFNKLPGLINNLAEVI